MENERYMVRVSCMTYNQSPYILQTLDGFCSQQTKFPFVCTVVDDASQDGEPCIISKYMQDHFSLDELSVAYFEETEDYTMTFARHKTNKECHFAVILLKYNHFQTQKTDQKLSYIARWTDASKYLAICEGDDYWTDPLKLQKQVDFLEAHPDCNLVYTDVNGYYQKDKKMTEGFFGHGIYRRRKDTHRDIIMWGWFLAPCTWVYRNGIVVYPEQKKKELFYGDIFVLLSLSKNGHIHYIDEPTAVYRILEESASHTKDPVKKFNFWKRGRATRASFAAKQPFWFRAKFFLFNATLAIRAIVTKKEFSQTGSYLSMLKGELGLLFKSID
jgi:glycosyltransferase involved in cell wall biosynthesis